MGVPPFSLTVADDLGVFSIGRDLSTMVPDIRYTPNPADAPVERGE